MPKGKGQRFERELCRLISEWWSQDWEELHDDLFWRSAGSGNRAKVRGRKGKTTRGHHGDITPTCPEANDLTELITLELKRGYNAYTLSDLLDRPDTAAAKEVEKWIAQVTESSEQANVPHWVIIHKRDLRAACVYLPHGLLRALQTVGCFKKAPTPFLSLNTTFRREPCPPTRTKSNRESIRIHATTLENFLREVKPEQIRALSRRESKRRTS